MPVFAIGCKLRYYPLQKPIKNKHLPDSIENMALQTFLIYISVC